MLVDLLTLGARCTLVGGKGGVGKTTAAAALAVSLAERGERVLALSVDPAHSLGDALGVPLGPEPTAVPGVPGLSALEVDAGRERDRFLGSHRGALLQLAERGTYLGREDVEGFLDVSVPGADELAALFRLMQLAGDASARLVVDTAPTGHTLRLLELPRLARGWLGALEAMEEKHRALALALAGAYHPDAAARLPDELAADLRRFSSLLADPDLTRFLLVTTPEPAVVAETLRYQEALARLGVALAGILVNRASAGVADAALGAGMAFVPRLDPDPTGIGGVRRFAEAARATPPPLPADRRSGPTTLQIDGPFLPPPDRRIYLVAGKGGVGKSTAAGALALLLAERGRVLLLGTDPAGSLGEVLGTPVGAEPAAVPGAPGLDARQVDAHAAWAEFRREYREEAQGLFAELLGGNVSAAEDQRVVERLVDLAPPGMDELVALMEVVDVLEDRAYDALVLDTAPTGHLLRLLEMPGLALEWAHSLLRLLLKYRDVVGLGSLAERVLRISRSLRALRERLTDPAHTWVLVVALPEALSIPETARLIERLRALGVGPHALLVNRLLGPSGSAAGEAGRARALLQRAEGLDGAAAPALESGPAGAAALREFIARWRRVETAPPREP